MEAWRPPYVVPLLSFCLSDCHGQQPSSLRLVWIIELLFASQGLNGERLLAVDKLKSKVLLDVVQHGKTRR